MDFDLPASALADARHHTPTPIERSRLMPFRETVLTLRAKRTSFENIAKFLNFYGVTIAPSTLSYFCRKHCPPGEIERVRRELSASTPASSTPTFAMPSVASALSSDAGHVPRRSTRIARDDL